MRNILYWPRIDLAQSQIIERMRGRAEIAFVVTPSFDRLAERWSEADGLVCADIAPSDVPRMSRLFRDAPKLGWLHIVTAGREGFESAGIPDGVLVTGPDGAHAAMLAEHAMAMMLNFTRRIADFARAQERQVWDNGRRAQLDTLEGKSLLIVGFGHAGRELAQRARGFGMRIVAAARHPKADGLIERSVPLAQLAEAAREADFLAVTVALTSETRRLIDARVLRQCKPGAVVVNVSRGGIVDPADLIRALQDGWIGGAALDVTDPEPLPADSPLWSMPNVLITPHIGGSGSAPSVERLADRVVSGLEAFLARSGH